VAVTAAWSLAAVSSPFSAISLLTARFTGLPPTTTGTRWNGGYALVALALLTGWLALIARSA
jgi:hypothetical protein